MGSVAKGIMNKISFSVFDIEIVRHIMSSQALKKSEVPPTNERLI
jgi:hypothetical protein